MTVIIDNPAGIYLFIVNNGNARDMCEICSKLIIKTQERRQWLLSGVFIVNFEQAPQIVQVYSLLNYDKEIPAEKLPSVKQ